MSELTIPLTRCNKANCDTAESGEFDSVVFMISLLLPNAGAVAKELPLLEKPASVGKISAGGCLAGYGHRRKTTLL
jgi:hypothetical protein